MKRLRGPFYHVCPVCGCALKNAAQKGGFSILECLSCKTQFHTSRWRRRAVIFALAAAVLYWGYAMAIFTPVSGPTNTMPALIFVLLEVAAVVIFIVSRPFEIHRRAHDCRTCGYDVHACTGEKCPECGTALPPHLLKRPE